jgi:predicted DCC family thiol-disulfide oxidoreductase YuxK
MCPGFPAPERTVVLYDEECGPCRWIADRLLVLDRRGRLRVAPIQGPEGHRLLASISAARRLDSMHVVDRSGAVFSAGAAIGPAVHELPFGAPLAWLAGLSPALTERAYRLAAANRSRLARVLGDDACAVDPQRPRSPRS